MAVLLHSALSKALFLMMIAACLLLLMVGCGGGGGSSSIPSAGNAHAGSPSPVPGPPTQNPRPTAQPSGVPGPTPTPPGPPPPGNVAVFEGCSIFMPGDWYNGDISTAPTDPNSAGYISSLMQYGDGAGFWASTGIEFINLANSRHAAASGAKRAGWRAVFDSLSVACDISYRTRRRPSCDGA